MIKNKSLRALAMTGLSLSLISAHSYAQFFESDARFSVTAEVEDSIMITGLNDVSLDLGSPSDTGDVYEWQKFTVLRRGATQDAPGHFSITASSEYGASAEKPNRHRILNQRAEELAMHIGYSPIDGGSGYTLQHDKPVKNMVTTNTKDEHKLVVSFLKDQLENPKPGIYSAAVTITVAAE